MLKEHSPKPWYARTELDPDRFVNFGTPGSQEWWYFDVISEDGRDALVIVFYAALPFDPEYGVQTLRHLRNPSRNPAPNPLDHCAIGFQWYREGKTIAYALNGFQADDFRYEANPFSVKVDQNVLSRDESGYHLTIQTPTVDGRGTIRASIRFTPNLATVPYTSELGTTESRHEWTLVAADCQVNGQVTIDGPDAGKLDFVGRGYHDHNAGSQEIRLAIREWAWGRVHAGRETFVYYKSTSHHGTSAQIVLRLKDGALHSDHEYLLDNADRQKTRFGLRYFRGFSFAKVDSKAQANPDDMVTMNEPVDQGPFYLRWVTMFTIKGHAYPGIAEWLETKNLHRFWFNWMIGYRLKRPKRV